MPHKTLVKTVHITNVTQKECCKQDYKLPNSKPHYKYCERLCWPTEQCDEYHCIIKFNIGKPQRCQRCLDDDISALDQH